MPRIISFAWTTPALVAGVKTCTRRAWAPQYARHIHAGDLMTAYDRNPRAHGIPVATIKITADPYLEQTRDAPPEDFEREGFRWLAEHGFTVDGLTPDDLWAIWHSRANSSLMYVVRFELVEVTAARQIGSR